MSVRHVGRQEAIKHRYQHLFGDFRAVKRIEDEKIKCQGESVKGWEGGATSTTRSAREAESDKRAQGSPLRVGFRIRTLAASGYPWSGGVRRQSCSDHRTAARTLIHGFVYHATPAAGVCPCDGEGRAPTYDYRLSTHQLFWPTYKTADKEHTKINKQINELELRKKVALSTFWTIDEQHFRHK